MPLTEDFSEFFDVDDFADSATFNSETVYGIFKRDYFLVGDVESRQPMFVCAEADVSGIDNEDTITIDGTIYNVIEPQPDGTGLITLVLNEA